MSKVIKGISSVVFYIFLAVIILVLILSSLGLIEGEESAPSNNSTEYQITNYKFNATVKQDNSIFVTEEITAHFSYGGKHGIYRAVPEITKFSYLDENGDLQNSKKLRFKYEMVNSNIHCETESSNNYLFMRFGTEDYTYSAGASETYNFSYYIYMDSRYADNDFFYFNTLGNMWDTTIANYSAKIKFETAVANPNTKIYVGDYGSTEEITNFVWDAEQKNLTYNASNLDVGEGVTLYVDLPENYFTAPFAHLPDIIMLVVILISALIIWRLFKKNSNKNFVIPVVQFKLEKNYTSADVGYIIDKRVNNKDIASLIILWAQKGYLEIIEEDKKTYLRKKQDADSKMKSYEKNLFDSIFDKKTTEDKINIKDIGEKIVDLVAPTKLQITTENSKLFNSKASVKRGLLIGLTALVFTITLLLVNYQNVNTIYTILAIPAGLLVSSYLYLLANNRDKQYVLNEDKKVFRIISFSLIFVALGVYCALSFDAYCDILGTVLLSFLLVALATMCVYRFNVRSDEGVAELGDIVGLRNFILTTEKDRMEMLLKENPQIFYDVLPYAYVLEVYDKWCKKFEGIVIESPNWYSSDLNAFDVIHFNYILSATTTSILSSINTAEIAKRAEEIASKAGSMGGSSSGGGFSGGGVGGGGGGSW